jgi:tRNA G10  N-methylase Trm11
MYYVASPEEDRELAYLEATVLLEEKVETPFHFSQHIVDISRSAYVKLCGIVVLKANSFVELIEKITEADFDFDQFRIEIHSSIRIRKDLPSQSKGVIEVADAIKRGNPNLNNPIISLDVLADENGYIFLNRQSISDNSWQAHIKKPYSFSSSLGARHSRSLVNIACHKAKTFLDPCCGFGNVVLEAAFLGYEAMGNDLNPKQVWYAEENLKHFGFERHIFQQDALTLLPDSQVDAIIVDFPYGLNSHAPEEFYFDFIKYFFTRTKILVTLTMVPFAKELEAAGYQVLGVAVPYKGYRFKRYVTLAKTKQQ